MRVSCHVRTRFIASVILIGGILLGCAVLGGCASSPSTETSEDVSDPRTEEPPAPEPEAVGEEAEPLDPDVAPEGFSVMEVFRVVPTGEGGAILLVDPDGRVVVPIFVGPTNAATIQLRLERRRYARPLTHDLLDEALERLDAEVLKVHIDDVKRGVFVGMIFVRDRAGNVMTLDARSSDAIAVAVGHGVPIFVHRDVIDKAGMDTDKLEEEGVPESDEPPDGPTTQPL